MKKKKKKKKVSKWCDRIELIGKGGGKVGRKGKKRKTYIHCFASWAAFSSVSGSLSQEGQLTSNKGGNLIQSGLPSSACLHCVCPIPIQFMSCG